jgi:hypothetical protein
MDSATIAAAAADPAERRTVRRALHDAALRIAGGIDWSDPACEVDDRLTRFAQAKIAHDIVYFADARCRRATGTEIFLEDCDGAHR